MVQNSIQRFPKSSKTSATQNLRKYLQTAILVVGSQPTYEDLKLDTIGNTMQGAIGSQPTYEDLKLRDLDLGKRAGAIVRSLPTRI
jgi:hypothetical protein